MATPEPIVYLIPTVIAEGALETIPPYVLEKVKHCQAFFVENERTARRYLKSIWKEIIIDDYIWVGLHKSEPENVITFIRCLKEGKTIGLLSEAGCPGIADPGQRLIRAAQELNIRVIPLVGPSSILLALMASGMNGQHFCFHGYLPIETEKRKKAIQDLERRSAQNNITQIFIETPYRNSAVFELLIRTCQSATLLCVAIDISGTNELIITKKIGEWKKQKPDLHKKPAIFLLYSGIE